MLILPLIVKGDVLFLLLNTEVKPICGVMLLQSEFKHFFSHSPFLLLFFPPPSFIIPCPHSFSTPQCLLLTRKLLRGSEQVAPQAPSTPLHPPAVPGEPGHKTTLPVSSSDLHKASLSPREVGELLIDNVCECFGPIN